MTACSLETRLLDLERQVRRTRRLSTALIVTLAALGAVAATQPPNGPAPADVVRAHAFEVVDSGGKVVLQLDTTPAGGRLRVLGSTGVSGVEAFVTDAGGRVVVFNPSGRFRLALGNDQFGGALTLANAEGSLVCAARADEKGEGVLSTWGRQGAGRLLTPHGVKQPQKKRDEDED